MSDKPIGLDGYSATIDMIEACARRRCTVGLSDESVEAVRASRELLRKLVESGRVIYGVTTGMGGLRDILVPEKDGGQMQVNLLRAVTSNVGECFGEDAVRAAMFARLNSLCRGHSAIQLSNLQVLLDMLNAQIHPRIPQKGSLGASGDLGPLAYIALAAMGDGLVEHRGEIMDASAALEKAGIRPMELKCKEGLALINGTSMMVGVAGLVVYDMRTVSETADVVAALSVETLAGKLGPFDERVHRQKPHPGQLATARSLQRLTDGSKMALTAADVQEILSPQHSTETTVQGDFEVMDAYSIRCVPQVHGPVKEYTEWCANIVERELNSSNDDPLVIPEYEDYFHNGHFHGQYISMAMDSLAIAANTLGLISDRRIDRFMDRNHSAGLPPFLCDSQLGVRLGLVGTQLMTSSLVAEDRARCTPMSIQSITSTEDFQDHVSLGLVGARRTRDVVNDTAYVLAAELLCGAQAADIRGPEKLSAPGRKTYDLVRELAPYSPSDISITPFIEKIAQSILAGDFLSLHAG